MLRIFLRTISTSIADQQRRQATKPFRESHKLPANVGIRHRLQAMEEDGNDIAVGPDMDIYEDMESDFSEVHLSHKEHEKEMVRKNELLKRRIVNQKYFDEHTPNFLTWSEKEHIRHLHNTLPQEWTPERLANSFPVDEAGVRKIIKAVWKPASQSRINRHDVSAIRNWKELKEGTIEHMTPEQKEHVKKYTHRVIPPRSQTVTQESRLIEMKERRIVGEFGTIVADYHEFSNTKDAASMLNNKKSTKENNKDHKTENSSDLVVSNNPTDISGHEKTTLSRLRSTIMNNSANISLLDKIIISPLNVENSVKDDDTIKMQPLPPVNQMKPHEQPLQHFQPENVTAHTFLEKIKIPSKAWKKGRTYKVNNCYYDDDGQFLYRVPGMSNIIQ